MRSPTVRLASLSRFHYLVAVLIAILWSVPPYFIWRYWQTLQKDPELIEPWMGTVMASVGFGLLADGWIMAILLLTAAIFLRRHKHRTFCLLVDALAIAHPPFGTALGAVGVAILMRPDVEASFESPPPAAS